MSHTRLRRYNARDAFPEQNLDNDFCQAVIAGNTVYLRGQVAQDLDTRESLATGDPAGQAEHLMNNVEVLLAEAGSRLEDICRDHRLHHRHPLRVVVRVIDVSGACFQRRPASWWIIGRAADIMTRHAASRDR